MDKISLSLRVYFDNPFWVGILEETQDHRLQVCQIVFGAEPQTEDILQWIAYQYTRLKWSPSVAVKKKTSRVNPKRQQRLVKQNMLMKGIGTKSQQALKLQHEERKELLKQTQKENLCFQKQRKFELQQRKKKEKHKGH